MGRRDLLDLVEDIIVHRTPEHPVVAAPLLVDLLTDVAIPANPPVLAQAPQVEDHGLRRKAGARFRACGVELVVEVGDAALEAAGGRVRAEEIGRRARVGLRRRGVNDVLPEGWRRLVIRLHVQHGVRDRAHHLVVHVGREERARHSGATTHADAEVLLGQHQRFRRRKCGRQFVGAKLVVNPRAAGGRKEEQKCGRDQAHRGPQTLCGSDIT